MTSSTNITTLEPSVIVTKNGRGIFQNFMIIASMVGAVIGASLPLVGCKGEADGLFKTTTETKEGAYTTQELMDTLASGQNVFPLLAQGSSEFNNRRINQRDKNGLYPITVALLHWQYCGQTHRAKRNVQSLLYAGADLSLPYTVNVYESVPNPAKVYYEPRENKLHLGQKPTNSPLSDPSLVFRTKLIGNYPNKTINDYCRWLRLEYGLRLNTDQIDYSTLDYDPDDTQDNPYIEQAPVPDILQAIYTLDADRLRDLIQSGVDLNASLVITYNTQLNRPETVAHPIEVALTHWFHLDLYGPHDLRDIMGNMIQLMIDEGNLDVDAPLHPRPVTSFDFDTNEALYSFRAVEELGRRRILASDINGLTFEASLRNTLEESPEFTDLWLLLPNEAPVPLGGEHPFIFPKHP